MGRDVLEEQRITVAYRLCDQFGAEDCARAGTAVDDDLLAPFLCEMLSDDARQRIGKSPGWKWNYQSDRLHRIRLR